MPFLAVEIPILPELVIIFAMSVLVVYAFQKFKIPPIVGFLLTGVILGKDVLNLVKSHEEIEVIAELGVILILFSIGIEFSVNKLLSLKKEIIIGGGLQVGLTIAAVYGIMLALGFESNTALFVGFLVALSSTAIVLNIYQSRGEIDSLNGKLALSILIFQDIIIVPMMLFTPIIAGEAGDIWTAIFTLFLKIIGVLIFLFVSIKYLMPVLIYQIAKTRIRELFLMATIMICLIVVFISYELGLSLALGAFLAGLIISETEYNHQALGNIIPFKDVFASFFFVSVGVLLDLSFVYNNLLILFLILSSVIAIKIFTAGTAVAILKYPPRIAVLVAFSLAQIGEFSFVLSAVGIQYNLVDTELYQYFLGIAVISMTLTPLQFAVAPYFADKIKHIHFFNGKNFIHPQNKPKEKKSAHLVIIGYGLNGKNLTLAAEYANIPYVIIDSNPDNYKRLSAQNKSIVFGDATSHEVMEHACIDTAKVCVIAISDPNAIFAMIKLVKSINPAIHLIVRTRYIAQMEYLYSLGADKVIPEEFETAVEIFTRVLTHYLVPEDEIHTFIDQIRNDGYQMLRSSSAGYLEPMILHIPNFEIKAVRVDEQCGLTGVALKDSNLRQKYNATLLGVRRKETIFSHPEPSFIFESDDVMLLFTASDKAQENLS